MRYVARVKQTVHGYKCAVVRIQDDTEELVLDSHLSMFTTRKQALDWAAETKDRDVLQHELDLRPPEEVEL